MEILIPIQSSKHKKNSCIYFCFFKLSGGSASNGRGANSDDNISSGAGGGRRTMIPTFHKSDQADFCTKLSLILPGIP